MAAGGVFNVIRWLVMTGISASRDIVRHVDRCIVLLTLVITLLRLSIDASC
jgi:hypothetical protein